MIWYGDCMRGGRGGVKYLQEVDSVLSTQSLNETHVCGLIAVLSQDTQVSCSLVQSLCALRETTRNSVMNKGLLEDFLEGSKDVHHLGSLRCLSGLDNLCISAPQSANNFKTLPTSTTYPSDMFVDVLTDKRSKYVNMKERGK
jgi:hypothetical protein